MKTNVTELRKIARECASVEMYLASRNTEIDHMSLSDKSYWDECDISWDKLQDEIECDYWVMDEDEYKQYYSGDIDFDLWFDDKTAKILVVVINSCSSYLKDEEEKNFCIKKSYPDGCVNIVADYLTEENARQMLVNLTSCSSFEDAEKMGYTVYYDGEKPDSFVKNGHHVWIERM